MKILFIGDIMGKPGRQAVRELLPEITGRYEPSVVIANCENAAAGFGVTRDIIEELFDAGIDVLTSGNHVWDKREALGFIADYETFIRPANYPDGAPGQGSVVFPTAEGVYVGVINLIGRVFMTPVDCPFRVAEREITRLEQKARVIIVDIHAEATSEKKALGYFLAERVSAVLGTHTHVQTADEEVLAGGAAYITDAGMTGPHESIIGIKKELVIERFLRQLPNRFEVARGDVRLQGVILDIDEKTGKSRGIERLDIPMGNAAGTF
ncbi:MAG: TIGR00282 family metallophosphoesterase [Smithellaceae bacterium]|nr:TIGR00282 family metallophosphoesterase [Smithellaceae bacterium]